MEKKSTAARRARVINTGQRPVGGLIVYWMSRDQRARDNWALAFAQELALESRSRLAVVFALAPQFLGACRRQYQFMLAGLAETERDLLRYDIPLYLLRGEPAKVVTEFVAANGAGAVVADFDPLKIKRRWRREAGAALPRGVEFYEVDTHNIVPCWVASDKQEYGARTLRPKIHRLLPEWLDEPPRPRRHPDNRLPAIRTAPGFAPGLKEWPALLDAMPLNETVGAVFRPRPGAAQARRALRRFIESGLGRYGRDRNDPNAAGQSGLSPYLHFGQLAPQRAAFEIANRGDSPDIEAFLEELIVRRELADNFCYRSDAYDRFSGFPEWARRTLDDHRGEPRDRLYGREEFESARTDDKLWNAAQLEMVLTGKMHGYLRMYWAKKILEWSESPEAALETAIYLNDRYELDGRDPAGYTGIAWAVGGVHDRAWAERPVFGKVRYMSAQGCRRKFDVDAYIARFHI